MGCDYGLRRGVAMVLAMVTALVLSPLYMKRRETHNYVETTGFVLPMLLMGLILAIKSASSSSSSSSGYDSSSSLWNYMPIIGSSSSWRLAGVLGMLLFVLYWQHHLLGR